MELSGVTAAITGSQSSQFRTCNFTPPSHETLLIYNLQYGQQQSYFFFFFWRWLKYVCGSHKLLEQIKPVNSFTFLHVGSNEVKIWFLRIVKIEVLFILSIINFSLFSAMIKQASENSHWCFNKINRVRMLRLPCGTQWHYKLPFHQHLAVAVLFLMYFPTRVKIKLRINLTNSIYTVCTVHVMMILFMWIVEACGNTTSWQSSLIHSILAMSSQPALSDSHGCPI